MTATDIPKHVLIVEDEPAIRGLLSLTLEAERYVVTIAEDGQEALSKLKEQTPDAILLDLMLPKVDGLAVIASLDSGKRSGQIPIIAVSAGKRRAVVGQQGVQAFLSKPFDMDTLLVVLEDALAASSADHQTAESARTVPEVRPAI